jgi:hypothetical protein
MRSSPAPWAALSAVRSVTCVALLLAHAVGAIELRSPAIVYDFEKWLDAVEGALLRQALPMTPL